MDYIGVDSQVHEYTRTLVSTFTVPGNGVAIPVYVDAWTAANVSVLSGDLPVIPSRLLTSVYDPLRGSGQVFDLGPNAGLPSAGYVSEQWNAGGGWATDKPSIDASAFALAVP